MARRRTKGLSNDRMKRLVDSLPTMEEPIDCSNGEILFNDFYGFEKESSMQEGDSCEISALFTSSLPTPRKAEEQSDFLIKSCSRISELGIEQRKLEQKIDEIVDTAAILSSAKILSRDIISLVRALKGKGNKEQTLHDLRITGRLRAFLSPLFSCPIIPPGLEQRPGFRVASSSVAYYCTIALAAHLCREVCAHLIIDEPCIFSLFCAAARTGVLGDSFQPLKQREGQKRPRWMTFGEKNKKDPCASSSLAVDKSDKELSDVFISCFGIEVPSEQNAAREAAEVAIKTLLWILSQGDSTVAKTGLVDLNNFDAYRKAVVAFAHVGGYELFSDLLKHLLRVKQLEENKSAVLLNDTIDLVEAATLRPALAILIEEPQVVKYRDALEHTFEYLIQFIPSLIQIDKKELSTKQCSDPLVDLNEPSAVKQRTDSLLYGAVFRSAINLSSGLFCRHLFTSESEEREAANALCSLVEQFLTLETDSASISVDFDAFCMTLCLIINILIRGCKTFRETLLKRTRTSEKITLTTSLAAFALAHQPTLDPELNVTCGYITVLLVVSSLRSHEAQSRVFTAVKSAIASQRETLKNTDPMSWLAGQLQYFLLFQSETHLLTREVAMTLSTVLRDFMRENNLDLPDEIEQSD